MSATKQTRQKRRMQSRSTAPAPTTNIAAATKQWAEWSEGSAIPGLGTSGIGGNNLAPFLPKCVHDAAEVIVIDEVPIYCADGWGARKAPDGAVVLNCTGTPRHEDAYMPKRWDVLRAHLDRAPVEEITLPWDDGGTPPVKATFWRALIELCAARKVPLVIHCIGGHGRTGTALAAILIAYAIPADDAIAFVRKNHCDKAIETLRQERYLAELDFDLNEATDAVVP